MKILKVLIPLMILLFHGVTYGQTDVKSSTRTTQLDFEDELIEGDISSPDLLFILKSKNANYGRLLKLRDHFLPEINETKYDILRGSK
ncbi:MAG: hypothetical protein ACRBBP_07485 [Bdellovibrionales bacterium]